MKSELSVEIERPIAEVFELTNGNVAEWSITCVEDELLEEKPGMVGSTFRLVTEDRGRRMELRGVVMEYEAPTLNAITMEGDAFKIDARYLFEDLGGRTRVTQQTAVEGKGFTKVMLFLLGWAMRGSACKAQQKELASLKRYCEERIPA